MVARSCFFRWNISVSFLLRHFGHFKNISVCDRKEPKRRCFPSCCSWSFYITGTTPAFNVLHSLYVNLRPWFISYSAFEIVIWYCCTCNNPLLVCLSSTARPVSLCLPVSPYFEVLLFLTLLSATGFCLWSQACAFVLILWWIAAVAPLSCLVL